MSENADDGEPETPKTDGEPSAPDRGTRLAGRPGLAAKLAAVVVVLLLVAAGLGALMMQKPGSEVNHKPNPPAVVNDTVATPPVFISEVMPAYGAAGSAGAFVELHVAPNITDIKDWRLTTYDNDSFNISAGAVAPGSVFVLLDFSFGSPALSLGAADELGLYDPQGRLVDFLRWGGGNSNTTRGVWPASDPGPAPTKGLSVSRLGQERFGPAAWAVSPPSAGGPNIMAVKSGGLKQAIWVHSGRNFTSAPGPDGSPALGPGDWVSRDELAQAALHLEYALRQMQRLGDPRPSGVSPEGIPYLEFWTTNGSTYGAVTERTGRVSIDLGQNGHINSYICARQMAALFETARWETPNEWNMFIWEGLAIMEGLRAAASEIAPSAPSIDGLWGEMRQAGLANPFEDGLDPELPFISPWKYGPDQAVCSWMFLDFCERKYLDAGLGTSLSQTLLASAKDPLAGITDQLGRNLTSLYWDWLVGRSSPGAKYPQVVAASTIELGADQVEDQGTAGPWAGRCTQINISLSGMAEFELLCPPNSSGPVQFLVVSYRNGTTLARTVLWPGQRMPLLVVDLQPLDQLLVVAAAGESPGLESIRGRPLPQPPAALDPGDGNYTNQSRPLFSWSTVDGAREYELQICSDRWFSTIEATARTAFPAASFESAIADGRHYWRVRAWTALGHPTGWSRVQNITVDTVPPFSAPIIGEPRYRASPDDAWNISTSSQISFNHEANDTLLFRFSDTEDWQVFHTGFVLSGAEGPRLIQYRCMDRAGNYQQTQILLLNLDVMPPVLSVQYGKPSFAASPGDMMNVSRATRVTLAAADNMSGVMWIQYRLDGQSWINYTGDFNLSGLAEGTHILATSLADRLGNGAQGMSQFFVDLTPPSFTLQNITNGSFINGDILMWVDGSDVCGMGSAGYLVDNIQLATAYGPRFEWLWRTSSSQDGYHDLEARVADNVGNTASAAVTVATENVQPVTTLAVEEPRYRASAGDTWNVTWATYFNLSVTHSFSGTTPAIPTWYTIDGDYREGTSFRLLGLPNGRHGITYGSRGVSGLNETPKCISVELDNLPPAPSIAGPAQDEVVCGTVLVNVTEASNATDVLNCTVYYSTDSVNWKYVGVDANGLDGWNVTWDTSLLANGNYWIKAEMADFLGNRGSIMISVNVQNT